MNKTLVLCNAIDDKNMTCKMLSLSRNSKYLIAHDSLLTVNYFVGALHFISPVSFSSVIRMV